MKRLKAGFGPFNLTEKPLPFFKRAAHADAIENVVADLPDLLLHQYPLLAAHFLGRSL